MTLYTHQYTRSQDPSEVPNLVCNVLVAISHLSSREEQENVSEGAEHSQGDEGGSQALGAASRAHACSKRCRTQRKSLSGTIL